jgi:hypothetical protein
MSLVAASLSSLLKDGSIPKYMVLIREIRESTDLDTVMHQMTTHFRTVLGHLGSQHIWYRVALTSASSEVATIFDDLSQVCGGVWEGWSAGEAGQAVFVLGGKGGSCLHLSPPCQAVAARTRSRGPTSRRAA